MALAIFFDVSPDSAALALRTRILGADEDAATRSIRLLADIRPAGDYDQDVTWDDRWFAGIADAALRGKFSGERLARIGTYVPGCRARRLAVLAAGLLRESPPSGDFLMDLDVAAFLELGAASLHLEMLRRAAVAEDAETRRWACVQLLFLQDRESTGLLIGFCGTEDIVESGSLLLAEIGGPAVERFLVESEDDAGLAVFHGLPRAAGPLFLEDGATSDPLRRLIRQGKPVEALLLALRREQGWVYLPGRVVDQRMRKWLVERRARREDVPWATQQLMLMGDAEARNETWAALSAGRYRWVDEAPTEVLTLDHDLSTIPHWIDDLESNCCRVNVVACIFDDLFGLDLDDVRNSACVTMAEVARRFWVRHGNDLVWSRVANRWVPGVR